VATVAEASATYFSKSALESAGVQVSLSLIAEVLLTKAKTTIEIDFILLLIYYFVYN